MGFAHFQSDALQLDWKVGEISVQNLLRSTKFKFT